MIKYIHIVVVCLLIISCKQEQEKVIEEEVSTSIVSDTSNLEETEKEDIIEIPSYDYDGLAPIFEKNDDKVYVINFWATWCKPCIEELPYFETLNEKYKDKNVEVILVSLDLPNQLNKGLKNFVSRKNIQAKVIHLNDPDQNTWIPKVNANWDGAIPATVIYKNDKRSFHAKSFTYDELEKEVKQFLTI